MLALRYKFVTLRVKEARFLRRTLSGKKCVCVRVLPLVTEGRRAPSNRGGWGAVGEGSAREVCARRCWPLPQGPEWCTPFTSLDHARPFVGVFEKSTSSRFVSFWRRFPSKAMKRLQERQPDTPTKGLLWTDEVSRRTGRRCAECWLWGVR